VQFETFSNELHGHAATYLRGNIDCKALWDSAPLAYTSGSVKAALLSKMLLSGLKLCRLNPMFPQFSLFWNC